MRAANSSQDSLVAVDKDFGPAVADLVLAMTPFSRPSARFVVAALRAGCLGVLDLTSSDRKAREELALVNEWTSTSFGVRLAGSAFTAADLPAGVGTVLLADWSAAGPAPADFPGRRVLVEVTDADEAKRAAHAGAHGLIARGNEAGGRVGELSTFVLLQRLLADEQIALPIWACGGIGPRTAAAAVAGGAAGVVLDTQLALLAEADLPVEITSAISALDGSETTLIDGRRVLSRPGVALDGPPLPVGQDVFLAARFQAAWSTVGAAVRGVRDAVLAIVDAAEPAGLSGIPVVQGPMTRVSDQPNFAAAVSGEGGLPFIALALSGPEQTRALLEATRDALAGAPWGVGVLGFAAEEVKAAQMDVIRAVRPSHAIIAGGKRPKPPPSKKSASRPSCTSPPPACSSSSSGPAPASSSSRARSVAGTSAPATASRCGRRRSGSSRTSLPPARMPPTFSCCSPVACTTNARPPWSRRWRPR
ncbi:hypothetical protein GCM10029976_033410 [Kribbella albertanoniae]